MNRFLKESELALKAVSAGAEMLEQPPRDLSVRVKESSRDIVTLVDVAVERVVKDILAVSGDPVITEEAACEGAAHKPSGGKWYVDPLDGTVNFVAGLPWYAVSAGFMKGNNFAAGAVIFPAAKELYYTLGHCGAFANERPLKTTPAALRHSLVAASFSGKVYDQSRREKEYLVFGAINDLSRGCLRMGSAALNVCCAASGKIGTAFGIGNKLWDVAGALAIASATGCEIFVEFIPGTYRVNFAVGAKGATNEVAAILKTWGLARWTRAR